jgi:Membrane bound beta barrel domain (DUF5777)
VKRCVPLLLMVWTLVAVPSAFAQSSDVTDKTAKTDKAEKADKNDKAEKADKDKKDKEAEKAKGGPTDASATAPAEDPAADPAAEAAAQDEKDDAVLDPAQPDFTVITLPTTLRLPKFRSAFRVTHRFLRPLGQGSFGDLVEDFFGFDASTLIGLEFRFGVWNGLQAGINRTSDKTIQFFGQYDIQSQSESFPIGLAAYVSIDGTNNFKDSYSPALGVVVSRTIARYAAIYVAPIWVNNSNDLPSELVDDNNTFFIGLGGRVRVHGSTYVVGEFLPRVSGFDPGVHGGSFGIEQRVGGHSFQLNFSNHFGTTMGPIARGGLRNADGDQDWFIGFNITRKFF